MEEPDEFFTPQPTTTPLLASWRPAGAPAESDGSMGPPATPVKTPQDSARKRKTPAKSSDDGSEADANATPTKKARTTPKPRQRKPPGKTPNKSLALATSYDLCAEHDKMLIDMRDRGDAWPDIRAAWEKMVGDKTAHSTLPNRYSRLKSNFVVIKEEDNAKLIEAKQEIEADFEREMWSKIAERMVAKGADDYKADALHRQYKKLMLLADDLQKGKVVNDEKMEA
ncbi:hypothetical protein LTR09_001946 [Extremus antarcticus]|uniref:Uncharacterized protein n=1 Tax=Extremus antarcticus TaxID=702011 RepID=A0AAJ0LVH3_9PEZI|nr:hypothetical protein LTR09_001946 [Extremus antarcticus]